MKKLNFLLSSLLLCMCCTIQAKNKVIEQPPFVNPEKPDVPLNKNDAFQKVQKRRVQEKR